MLSDALFGNDDGSELGPSMANMTEFKTLGEWTSAQWIELLNECVPRLSTSPLPSN